MAHFVNCKYCGIRFDRDIEPFVEVTNRRYAHKSCFDKVDATIPQDEKDYNELEKYIKKLFKLNNINAKIKKQIRDFRQEYGYSYTGILKTLYWWYEIKDHTTELAQDGIGIVPFVYKDAEKYFYAVYLAKMVNAEIEYKPRVEVVEISPPKIEERQPRLFNFEDKE